jgi:hypothetical protein
MGIEFLMALLKVVIMIVVPVATSVLTYCAKKAIDKFISKIQKQEVADALYAGTKLIFQSVDYVQQTYVDELKKADKFSKEAHQIALEKAKDRAISLMNEDITNAIEASYGNIDNYVVTIIESIIQQGKKG